MSDSFNGIIDRRIDQLSKLSGFANFDGYINPSTVQCQISSNHLVPSFNLTNKKDNNQDNKANYQDNQDNKDNYLDTEHTNRIPIYHG